MKLINFHFHETLNALRNRMGAPLLEEGKRITWKEKKNNDVKGFGILEVENLDDVTVGVGGVLLYNGQPVIVYIPDGPQYKYHVSDCRTLQNMRFKGRYSRYILTRRTDGQFKILPSEGRDYYYKLDVCKYCLEELGYNTTSYSVKKFSLSKFFKQNSIHNTVINNIPKYTDSDAKPNIYPKEFPDISKKLRENHKFICTKCQLNLESDRKYLHTHHKNGVKYDNESDNLVVLCIGCHAQESNHQHMKLQKEYMEFVNKYNYV